MWRQVKLTCLQGRNLGASRPLPEDFSNTDPDAKPEADAIDLDVYCEIYINGILSGRTTVKKSVGSPDWSESFTFSDLSPFENLEIVVYRERKLVKPVVVGSILLYLMNFRRGDLVEGWFPVVNNSGAHAGVQLGDLRLKIRVDEYVRSCILFGTLTNTCETGRLYCLHTPTQQCTRSAVSASFAMF